ncbi:uncharacterized protein [Asterias amurensis]|uniref:uncharacterized protein n=1 Tax=Asterias amurensis TaxID=7602 RepID=UPI003AB19D60
MTLLFIAVLFGSASLLVAQDGRIPLSEYPAEFYSEGDQNVNGQGLLICSIMSPLQQRPNVNRVDILYNNEVIDDSDRNYFLTTVLTDTEYAVHVVIYDLSRANSGLYTCRAFGLSGELVAEAVLQFDVNYLPESLYPTCSMLGSRPSGEPIQHGESVTLLCSSKVGSPAVQLTWQDDRAEFKSVLQTESKQYVQSEVTLDAVYAMDGAELTCVSRSEAFPDYRGSCTLGPLIIAPPSDDGTTMMSTDAQQTTLANENIDQGGTTQGGSEVSTSSGIERGTKPDGSEKVSTSPATLPSAGDGNQLLGDGSVFVVAVVVLSTMLCTSIILNIYCALRSKRQTTKTVPVEMVARNQTSDSHYQGLNNSSTVTQGPYTALNTPIVSLKTVTKKSEIVNYAEATAGEEEYAQVDNPKSPRHLEDTVERYQVPSENSDSAYVNLNIPSRSKLR